LRTLLPLILIGFVELYAEPSAATGRAAVVVANEDYRDQQFATARADGELISNTLREADFDVLLIQNFVSADHPTTLQAIADHATNRDISLLYFVGLWSSSNVDILLQSVDAKPDNARPVGLSLQQIIAALRERSKSAIIVLDGVPVEAAVALPRSSQIVRSLQRQASIDLGEKPFLLSYSGAVSPPSVGNGTGANSIFATIFANTFAQRGVPIQKAFRDIRRSVREATRGAQLPTTEGNMAEDLILKPILDDPLTEQPRPPLDQIFWTIIKGSADEADFELFENRFSKSVLVERAAARRIALSSATSADVGTLTRAVSRSKPVQQTTRTEASQTLAFGTSGDRAPPVHVRRWPSVLPQTPGGLGTMTKPCDYIAGDPDDPMRVTPGIQWGLVNLRVAVRTCLADLSQDAQNRRLLFQVGRVLDMLNLHIWAESFYREAARLGYSAGFANLAYMHIAGRGRPADMEAAVPYLKLGADQGNPRSRTDLGFAYLRGFGVERSPQEALLWLRLAAASGWPNALDILANMYLEGDGVEKDAVVAMELFQAAAWVGNTNAMSSLGLRYLYGQSTERNPAMARSWFEKSIAVGNAFAPLYLGQMYRDGNGVAKSLGKAVELIRLSAERGFGEARYRLGEIYEKGEGVPRDLETAAFNYTLTERQTFEHPVLPIVTAAAKERLKQLMPRLSAVQAQSVERRVQEYTKLNGP
jgi:uncharacterized protein